jgi:hypothetical protein
MRWQRKPDVVRIVELPPEDYPQTLNGRCPNVKPPPRRAPSRRLVMAITIYLEVRAKRSPSARTTMDYTRSRYDHLFGSRDSSSSSVLKGHIRSTSMLRHALLVLLARLRCRNAVPRKHDGSCMHSTMQKREIYRLSATSNWLSTITVPQLPLHYNLSLRWRRRSTNCVK